MDADYLVELSNQRPAQVGEKHASSRKPVLWVAGVLSVLFLTLLGLYAAGAPLNPWDQSMLGNPAPDILLATLGDDFQLSAHRGSVAHGRVEGRGKHEPDSRLPDAPFNSLGRQLDVDPQGF